MNKLWIAGLSLATVTALTACGGGSSGTSTSSSDGNTTTPTPVTGTAGSVAGPLDAVQTPVSSQVISPLKDAASGTPLYGLLTCTDQIVVHDALDVVDAIAAAVQSTNPAALASTATAANLQNQLQNLAVDINGMLSALKGDAEGCVADLIPTGANPLAGTPLAPVGAQLAPVLQQVFTAVAGNGNTPRPTLSLSQLIALYSQLNNGVNLAFTLLPPEVTGAPVLGPAVTTVKTTLAQVGGLLAAVNTGNPATVQTSVASTVNSVLKGVLLDVVPVRTIETEAGQTGVLSTPLAASIDSLTALIGNGNLDSLQPQAFLTLVTTNLTPVLAPVHDTILGDLLNPLFDALTGVTTPSANPLSPVISALNGFVGGSPTPLLYITSTIDQVLTLGGSCPTAGTPLAALCTLNLGGLLGGLLP